MVLSFGVPEFSVAFNVPVGIVYTVITWEGPNEAEQLLALVTSTVIIFPFISVAELYVFEELF